MSSKDDEESLRGGESTSLFEDSKDQHNTSLEDQTSGADFLQKEDLDSIFERVQMPSLMLTRLKVKKSKQGV